MKSCRYTASACKAVIVKRYGTVVGDATCSQQDKEVVVLGLLHPVNAVADRQNVKVGQCKAMLA